MDKPHLLDLRLLQIGPGQYQPKTLKKLMQQKKNEGQMRNDGGLRHTRLYKDTKTGWIALKLWSSCSAATSRWNQFHGNEIVNGQTFIVFNKVGQNRIQVSANEWNQGCDPRRNLSTRNAHHH
jgi:hypothetical protein